MHSRRLLLAVTSALALGTLAQAQNISAAKLRWKGGAKAALTIIHDDLCGGASGVFTHADSIAHNRGIAFGTGAIVGSCGGQYDRMDKLVEHGHEIVSHSWSHANASNGWNAANEITKSKQTLEQNLTKQKTVDYFIFPYDRYGAGDIANLKSAGYISARTGPQSWEDDSGVTVKLNAFTPFNATYYFIYHTKEGNGGVEKHATEAIATGGWANQEFHGIADGSYDQVPNAAAYRQYLDWLVARREAGDLWISPPTAVVKYIMTFNGAGEPSVAGNILSFPSAAVQEKYATAITIALKAAGASQLTAKQGGVLLPITKKGDSFLIDVDPTQGPVILSQDAAGILKSLVHRGPAPDPARAADASGRRAGTKTVHRVLYLK
jgi:hypothetical protein